MPFTLILIMFGKKKISDLLAPFSEFIRFIFEPVFTVGIIIVNVSIFVLSNYLGYFSAENFANYPLDIFQFRLHTLITSGFFHANLTHVAGNMLGIFIFGRIVEKRLGFLKTALVYFGALFLSNIFSSLIHVIVLHANVGGIGASGALMGLVATALLMDPFYFTYEFIIPLPVMIVGWIALYSDIAGILNPVEDGIGHFAHLGGFLSVGLIMYIFGAGEKSKLKKGFIINIVSFAVLALGYWVYLNR